MTTRTVPTELTPAQRQAFEEAVERYGKSFFANPDLIWKTLLEAVDDTVPDDVHVLVDGILDAAIRDDRDVSTEQMMAEAVLADRASNGGSRDERRAIISMLNTSIKNHDNGHDALMAFHGALMKRHSDIRAASPKPTDAEKEVGDGSPSDA